MIKKIVVFLMIILGVGVENAVAACGGLNANSDDWTYSMTGNSDDNQCASCPVVFNLSDSPSQYGADTNVNMWYVHFGSYKVYGVALENGTETCSCAVDKFVKIIQTDSEPQEETLLELNGTGNVFETTMESSGCLYLCAQWFHDNESERVNSGFWYQDPEKNHALRNTVTDCSFQLTETETGGTKTYKVSAKNSTAWGNKELILLSPKTGYCVDNNNFVAIESVAANGKYCNSSRNVEICPNGTCCLNGYKYDCIRGTYFSAGKKCQNDTAGQCGAARDGNYFENGREETCLAGTCCLAGIKYDCKNGTISATNGSVCTGISDGKGECDIPIEDGQYLNGRSPTDCEMGYCCANAKRYNCTNGTFTVSTKTVCTSVINDDNNDKALCLKFSGGNGGWTWPASGLNIGPINLSGN